VQRAQALLCWAARTWNVLWVLRHALAAQQQREVVAPVVGPVLLTDLNCVVHKKIQQRLPADEEET
tara:strand:- start:271 stop:468 length:198 start_codon:yes stop_codon:yes gene_type:complete